MKSEPEIQQLMQQGGTKAQVTDQLVSCIATALEKDADSSDLKDYVNGKKNLDDVGCKTKGSSNDAQNEAKNCAQSAVGGTTASSSPSQ